MNRRTLMQAALAVLTFGLLPRKRKATKEELNRLLNTAVNRYIQDNPEKFAARLYELQALHPDHERLLCNEWTGTIWLFDPPLKYDGFAQEVPSDFVTFFEETGQDHIERP